MPRSLLPAATAATKDKPSNRRDDPVVFYTNILFSAVYKRAGVPAQVIDLVTAGVLTPCVSDAVMAEYEEVLIRPVLRPHAHRAREVLRLMSRFAVHVTPAQTLALCSDPDDDRFLECASEAQAAYLVTGNVRHYPKDYAAVLIVTPRDLLRRLAPGGI